MKLANVAALALCAITLSGSSCEKPGVHMTRIERGTDSGVTERLAKAITTQAEWSDLWKRHKSTVVPAPELPSVDFSKNTVLAVFAGQKNSGGYSITVTGVIPAGSDKVRVVVDENSPPEGAMTTQALTQPFDIIRINKPGQKAIFAGF
jgi:hypothetical protein